MGNFERHAVQTRSSANVDDLIHLPGPLTEDAVLKTLQARYYAEEFFVSFINYYHNHILFRFIIIADLITC